MLLRFWLISMAFTMLIPVHAIAGSTEAEDQITELCLAGFKAAMAQAGKIPPDGMGRFTCECFLTEVNRGKSIQWPKLLGTIESAQKTCKQRAAERFEI